jgi:hypothetical protein
MPNGLARQSKSRRLFVVGVTTLVLVIGLLCIEYRQYAYSVAWHRVHGDYAEFGGHRIRLPILWRREDSGAYNTSLFVRACPGVAPLKPEIVVSPTISGEVENTDQEELKAARDIILLKEQDNIAKTQLSLVMLTPRSLGLYCVREDAAPFGAPIFSNLSCHAARIPFSFTYNGHPTAEKEAESILSTIE